MSFTLFHQASKKPLVIFPFCWYFMPFMVMLASIIPIVVFLFMPWCVMAMTEYAQILEIEMINTIDGCELHRDGICKTFCWQLACQGKTNVWTISNKSGRRNHGSVLLLSRQAPWWKKNQTIRETKQFTV